MLANTDQTQEVSKLIGCISRIERVTRILLRALDEQRFEEVVLQLPELRAALEGVSGPSAVALATYSGAIAHAEEVADAERLKTLFEAVQYLALGLKRQVHASLVAEVCNSLYGAQQPSDDDAGTLRGSVSAREDDRSVTL